MSILDEEVSQPEVVTTNSYSQISLQREEFLATSSLCPLSGVYTCALFLSVFLSVCLSSIRGGLG